MVTLTLYWIRRWMGFEPAIVCPLISLPSDDVNASNTLNRIFLLYFKLSHIWEPSHDEHFLCFKRMYHIKSTKECWLTWIVSKLLPSRARRSKYIKYFQLFWHAIPPSLPFVGVTRAEEAFLPICFCCPFFLFA